MSPSSRLLLALLSLSPSACLLRAQPVPEAPAAEPPEKIARFEQMLVRSPGPGRAFDEVFGHWFTTAGGPAALEARWLAAREAAPAGSAQAAAYGLLLGQLAERIGDADTARTRYAAAAAAAPADFRAWHRLGRLELREGKAAAGIAALEKAVALDLPPADAQDVLRDLARARSRALDEAGALAAWKDLAARFPDDALVLEEVGQAQLDAAAYDEAAATFTALEKAAAGDAYRAVLARLRLGEVAAKKGEREAALARFSAALDGTHRDSWLHREALARVDALFRQQGDFDGLVAFHEARLAGSAREPAAARRLAELLLELGRADAAFAWFEKAAAWAPEDHALRFAHARALLGADRADAALPLLQTLVRLHPREADYRGALGQLHWDRAKALAPTDAPASAAERALALETWAALAPDGAPVADLLALAELYRAHGLDEETRATLARALAAEPVSYDLRERLALQLLAMKRDEEAWTVARNEPAGLTDPAHYRRLASLQRRNDLTEAALASVDRGLALAPGHYELLDLRWQILAEQQKWDEALALLPGLRAASPGDFALENLEARHLQILKATGQTEPTRAALAERVANGDAALTEIDFRLYLRLVLGAEDAGPEAAETAFAAARARFPDSFSLAHLESEHLERTAPLAARVAALRRLLALRPERAVEWQRRIVGAHRFEGDFDGARLALAELLALAPADPQNHLLAAELEFDSGAAEAGLAALQRALRLAADPAPIRLRLARAYADQGRPASALPLLEEIYFAATDEAGRRAIAATLAETALAAGDLEGLLARFAERRRPERETAAYHGDLGELHFHARDQVRAQEAWNRALALRPDDARLLSRLLDLARDAGDQQETLRLARLRHERQPSPAHALALGEALLETQALDEALGFFLPHAAEFFQNPELLTRVLPALAGENLAQPLIERLQATAAAVGDVDARDFALATALVSAGDLNAAERLLWQIYERPENTSASQPAPVAQPTSTPSTPAAPVGLTPAQLAQQAAFRSLQTTQQAFGRFQQILQQQSHGRSRFFGRSTSFGPGGGFLAPNPREPQDTALGYLGALALHREQAESFVARVDASLAARGLPASARLHEYAKIQSRALIRRDIEAALAESSPSPAGLITARNFINPRHDPFTGVMPEPDAAQAELLRRLDEALLKLHPSGSGQIAFQRIARLAQQQKPAEAAALARELLAANPPPTGNERRQLEQFLVHLQIESGDWPAVLAAVRAAVGDPSTPSHFVFHAFQRYLLAPAPAAGETDLLPEFSQLVLDALVAPTASGPNLVRGRVLPAQQEIFQLVQVGAPLAITSAFPALQQQWMFSQGLANSGPRGEAALEAIAAAAARHPDEKVRLLGPALVFGQAFQALDTARAEKIGAELLALRPDPALEFNLAELAHREGRTELAHTRYSAITGATGSLAIAVQLRLLEIALLDEKDREPAKAAAKRLLALRPPQHLPNLDLNSTLRELGLASTPGTAASTAVRSSGTQPRQQRPQRLNQLGNELNELINKNDHDDAERLARRLVREVTPQDVRQGNDWPRRRALEGLVRIGRMDAYLAELEADLARTPGSIALLEQLADAHGALRQNSGRTTLSPAAATAAPLPLPARLRLTRRGDTFVAAYAALPAAEGTPPPGNAEPQLGPSSPPAKSAPAAQSAPELVWTELGRVELPGLGDATPGLVARQQHFRDLASARFADPRQGAAAPELAALAARDSLRIENQNTFFHRLPAPLSFASESVVEVTLLPASSAPAAAASGPRERLPAGRGLALRDGEGQPRVLLALSNEGHLTLLARRHTGSRELDYLAQIVARGSTDERLRSRYIEALFQAKRADEAIAFLSRPEQGDLIPRFANQDQIVRHFREAGRLSEFADLVLARAARPQPLGAQPQVEHNVVEFARRLSRDNGTDPALALRVWQQLLPLASDHQAAEVRSAYLERLLASGASPTDPSVLAVVRDYYLTPAVRDLPSSPAFEDSLPRYHRQPWPAASGHWGNRFHLQAFNLLDDISDPALLRALIADHAPRLTDAATDAWEVRCYDVLLRLRAYDPSAVPAFAAVWRDALADAKRQIAGGRHSNLSPLQAFVPAALDRLATWPDPDGAIDALFREILAEAPAVDAPRLQYSPTRLPLFQSNFIEPSLRLLRADQLLARGDQPAALAALDELARIFARQDPRQLNQNAAQQLLDRLVLLAPPAEARRIVEGPLRRFILSQSGQRGPHSPLHSLLGALDVLEGTAGSASKPALAIWTRPDAEGRLELRWEIGVFLGNDTPQEPNSLPPVFGRPRAAAPDGVHDLVVQFLTSEKAEPTERLVLEAVPARGRHTLAAPLPAGLLRASLRPRAGGEEIPLPLQVFSSLPNQFAHPAPRVTPAAGPGGSHRVEGWQMPLLPTVLPVHPSGEGHAVRIDVPPRNNGEHPPRSEPVPLDPTRAYLVEAWALVAINENAQLALEFLDEAGAPLDNPREVSLRSPEPRWQRVVFVLGSDKRSDLPGRQRLPEKARALRLSLRGNSGGLSLADLALRELPPAPPPPQP